MSVSNEPVQPEEGQGQPQVTEVPAPAAESLSDSPWAADLNLLFEDQQTRTRVDEYMRTKVQPHTTKLEQQLAETKDAQRLFTDLNENPGQALVNLTAEVYGQEAATDLANYLNAQAQQTQEVQQAQQAQFAQLDPQTAAEIAALREYREEQVYEAAMKQTIAANPDIDPDDLHIWVAQTEDDKGNVDFNAAVGLYRGYIAKHVPASTDNQVIPPVTGSDVGSAQSTTVPAQRTFARGEGKKALDDAIEDFVRTNRKQEAPPVS